MLTNIGVSDNVVDLSRHAKFYRAPFSGFAPIYVIFRTIWGDVFNAFLNSCNFLQPTPLNRFLRNTAKRRHSGKGCAFLEGPDDHN